MSQQDRVNALLALQGQHSVEDYLLHGDFDVGAASIGNTNEAFEVTDANTGRVVGVFKPRDGISLNVAQMYRQTRNSVLIAECVAWQVARLLGPPFSEIVAPCVLRKLDGRNGALAQWREGAAPDNDCFLRRPDQCLTAGLLDSIIGQQDRNDTNYLWDPAAEELALIDHGFAFARGGDTQNTSLFHKWRWDRGDRELANEEQDAVRAFASATAGLSAIEQSLEPARAEAFRARVESLRDANRLLRPLEYAP